MVELVDVPEEWIVPIEAYCGLAQRHRWGGEIDGRLVAVRAPKGGWSNAVSAALAKWMKPHDYERWQADQAGRPVGTGGKTFVADDEVPTAIVPVDDDLYFSLRLAGHELLELVRVAEAAAAPPVDDTTVILGMVLADEYVIERARTGMWAQLGWPACWLDGNVGLRELTDQVAANIARSA